MLNMFEEQTFEQRIVTMMRDYSITFFDALLWEFECVYADAEKLFKRAGHEGLEYTFRDFLKQNGVTIKADLDYYTGIFMGREENLVLYSKKS